MITKLDKVNKEVGMNIRLRRTKMGISQEELAYNSEISRGTMGSIERGESSPTIETLAKISNALNIELYKLFIFED